MNERRADAARGAEAKPRRSKPRRKLGKSEPAASQLSGPAPAERPWSVPVAASDIPETGRRVELTADAATRIAVAKAVGVVALPRLEAVFDLMPLPGAGARVAGRVSATVEQHCVVTLEPIESRVEEPVDLVFQPPAGGKPDAAGSVTTLDQADPPEPLIGGVIDLGAMATEFLLLGIDPYPRKPDAAFQAPAAKPDPAAHPFAALAALKKDPGGQNR